VLLYRAAARADVNNAMFTLYMEANSVQNHKQGIGQKIEPLLSSKDFRLITSICQDEDPFRLIVNSVCPSIYGHELVKGMYPHTHTHTRARELMYMHQLLCL
jgi:DNA replicative helicase MCM subunit Mcm2 (Cdc46/Mcm family)